MADKHDIQLRSKWFGKKFPFIDTVDNLESDNPDRPLSARQGKILKELIDAYSGSPILSIEIIESLPVTGVKGILYLVPKTSYLKEENTYDEYVWIESSQKYELLGSFSTDLNIEEYINKINSVLGEVEEINVETLSDYEINSYVTTGTYRVYGERINSKDGLPILNTANGHTIEGILKVLDSSISGSGEDTDKVVTQVLTMSNRTGGDGHIWVRTGQGADKTSLTWSTWEKLQGIFEKNIITTDPLEALDSFTTNGMYSGIFTQPFSVTLLANATYAITTASQFLVVTVNGYNLANPQLGGQIPVIMQTIYLVYNGKYCTLQRSGTWNGASWSYDTFREQSRLSINEDGSLRTLKITGKTGAVIGTGSYLGNSSVVGDSARIESGLKFTYADDILTITARDGKKTTLTLE